MSRSWHSPRQRGSASGRTSQRMMSSRPISHPEDAQPNESVDKRQRCPPAVNIAAAPAHQSPRRIGQGPRRTTQFVPWGPSGSMRPTASEPAPLSTPSQSTNNNKWRLRSSVSTPSLTLQPEPPPPKRRKLECPPLKRGSLTDKIIPPSMSSVSPVSSETLVGEPRVKKERSISPELSSTERRLITAGTKRYAPLPPECMKSQPNYKAARSAWAKKVHDELKKLGLKVVRTFIREDGMAIDWETTADTSPLLTVEPDYAPVPSIQSVTPTVPSLAQASGDLGRPSMRGASRSPSVVEIAFPGPSEGGDLRGPNERSSSGVVVGQMSDPSSGPHRDSEGGSQQHGHPSGREDPIDASAPNASLQTSPVDSAHISSSDLSRLQQTTSNVPSRTTPSEQTGKQPTSPQTPLDPQRHTTSPRHSPLPSPSQRAVDTLHHILHLKRQMSLNPSESPKPPAVSPVPSPFRKLYPLSKTRSGSPSRRSPGSSADAVAAAINEGTRLDRPSGPALSTPLRVYKKRSSSLATPIRQNERGVAPGPGTDKEHQARRSLSSDRHSTPPIAVLGARESSPESQKALSSLYGEEYDELELSYPPSPSPPREMLPDSLPVANVPIDPARPGEPVKQAVQPSQPDPMPPSLDENATMRSSALRYLQHYFQTFDIDRRTLAEAYAPDAVFSCSSRNLRAQGRDRILDALQALGPGILCSGHNVEFDVTYLGPGIGVLLVALGIMGGTGIGVSKPAEVEYAMTFMLRPGLDRERLDGGLRPLVAAVHQVVLKTQN